MVTGPPGPGEPRDHTPPSEIIGSPRWDLCQCWPTAAPSSVDDGIQNPWEKISARLRPLSRSQRHPIRPTYSPKYANQPRPASTLRPKALRAFRCARRSSRRYRTGRQARHRAVAVQQQPGPHRRPGRLGSRTTGRAAHADEPAGVLAFPVRTFAFGRADTRFGVAQGQNFMTVSVEQSYCSLPAGEQPISTLWP